MCQALCWLLLYTYLIPSLHNYCPVFIREDLELGVDKVCEVVPSSANPSQVQHSPFLRSPSELGRRLQN